MPAWPLKFAAWLALASCTAAQAGRPLVTEDAPVLGSGECAVESYVGRLAADGGPTDRLLSSQLGCGFAGRTQLSVAGARVWAQGGHGDVLTLAGKTAFAGTAGATEWSLAYGATARRTGGIRTQMDQLYATLVATVQLSPTLASHLNLGWTGARHPVCHTTRWAIAFEQAVSDDLHLVAEAFADDRNRRPWFQVGAWAALNKQVSVNGSYGRTSQDGGARALTLGVTVGF